MSKLDFYGQVRSSDKEGFKSPKGQELKGKHGYENGKHLYSEHSSREGEAQRALLVEGATQAPETKIGMRK
jgi:hypothetical protein